MSQGLPALIGSRVNTQTRRLVGSLAVGAAVTNTVPVSETVTVAGSPAGRVYFKATAAGSLYLKFLTPDGQTVYSTTAIGPVAVVANTEVYQDFNTRGEQYMLVQFVPSGNGAVSFCDVCNL